MRQPRPKSLRSFAPGSMSRPLTRRDGDPRKRDVMASSGETITISRISAVKPCSSTTFSTSATVSSREVQPGANRHSIVIDRGMTVPFLQHSREPVIFPAPGCFFIGSGDGLPQSGGPQGCLIYASTNATTGEFAVNRNRGNGGNTKLQGAGSSFYILHVDNRDSTGRTSQPVHQFHRILA